MDVRRLKYFLACAEELHFTRAARRIGIAQPPLSQQIQVLEAEVGTRLFHRLSRGVELTPAGVVFLQDVRVILDLLDRAVIAAQQIARGEQGSIRIGFTSSAALNPFVPAMIRDFRARYDKVDVSLTENTTSVSLEQLRAGRMDMAFLRPAEGETEGLVSRLLFEEEMLAALPAQHALITEAKLRLNQLAAEPFVLYPRVNGRAMYDTIIGACQNGGFSPRIVQEAPQMATTVSLVAAGIGVSIVPQSMTQLQTEGVVYRPILGPSPKAAMYLVCREGPLSSVMKGFMDMARRAAARHAPRDVNPKWPLGSPGGEGPTA